MRLCYNKQHTRLCTSSGITVVIGKKREFSKYIWKLVRDQVLLSEYLKLTNLWQHLTHSIFIKHYFVTSMYVKAAFLS